MILKKDQSYTEIESQIEKETYYVIRAIRHEFPVWPRKKGSELKDRLIELNYINDNIAMEDIEIKRWHH